MQNFTIGLRHIRYATFASQTWQGLAWIFTPLRNMLAIEIWKRPKSTLSSADERRLSEYVSACSTSIDDLNASGRRLWNDSISVECMEALFRTVACRGSEIRPFAGLNRFGARSTERSGCTAWMEKTNENLWRTPNRADAPSSTAP